MSRHHASSRLLRGQKGAVMIEAALTLPLLLLVAVGIFEFGRAYQTWQVLTNAAREGARMAVVPNSAQSTVQDRVRSYLQAGQLSNYGTAVVTVNSNSSISMGATTASASVVTVQYPFDFVVLNPVARLVVGSSTLGSAPLTMTASTAMRNETQ